MRPPGGLRPASFETLFGLIAAAGLRISEALALLDADVDLKAGMLTIRQSKFGKSRLVPLHPSTVEALERYRRLRDRHVRTTAETPFFIGTRGQRLGQPLGDRQVHRVFIELREPPRLGQSRRSRWSRASTTCATAFAVRRLHALASAGRRHRSGDAGAVDLPGPRQDLEHLLVPHRRAGADGTGRRKVRALRCSNGERAMSNAKRRAPPSFAALVQAFFAEHLTAAARAEPAHGGGVPGRVHAVPRLCAQTRCASRRRRSSLSDITPELILAFLDHLEHERHNTVRSRNARLAALRAFLKFAAHRDVSSLHVIEHALGVPMKRFERPMLGFLSREEMLAVIGTPGSNWISQRDHSAAGHALQHRCARVGDHRRALGRRGARRRSLRASARQGAQAAHGAAVALDGQGDPGVAEAEPPTCRRPRRCCPTGTARR